MVTPVSAQLRRVAICSSGLGLKPPICEKSSYALSFCLRGYGQGKAADIPCALLFRRERADARRTLLARFEMGECPLPAPRRQVGSVGIAGGKRIVVADHYAES
jgi:hypothetical protein